MRRSVSVFAVAAVLIAGSALPARARAVVPPNAHPMGQSHEGWSRDVGQFFLGDSSNPLFAGLEGDCGQLIDGVFFMAAPIDVGVELD